jgi:hypothetical protein
MSDVKISELPVAVAVSDSDSIVLNQGGITKTAPRSLVRNAGTVTSVTAGAGLTGGTIIASGTIALQTSGIAAGTYGSSAQIPSISVDQYGRVTGATAQTIAISTTDIAGIMPVSKGGTGASTAVQALANLGAGTVTSITAGTGLTGGTIAASGTIALATSGVAAGSFGSTSQIPVITVDQFGRITSASQTTLVAGTVTSITAGTGLSGGTITDSGTIAVTYGSSSSTACEGNDPRLSDVRTPTGAAGGDLSGTYPSPGVKALNGQVLASLQTGLLKNTAVTGIPSIAVAGTDYLKPVMDVQTFSSSGTWTKPAGARAVKVQLWSGGGGGGSGRKGAAGTVRCGGGGGGSGGYWEATLDASVLGSTESVLIGGTGASGASQTTNSTNGSNGGQGGTTSFGSWLTLLGGNGGSAGSATTGFGGGGSVNGNTGSAASTTGGQGVSGIPSGTGSSATIASGAGASGSGITAADGTAAGVAGGRFNMLNLAGGTAGANNGGNGGNGTSMVSLPTNGTPVGAGGGGSGGSSTTTNGGVGGNGGFPGGGGGGGSASLDNVGNSGAGGLGGPGAAIITTYF